MRSFMMSWIDFQSVDDGKEQVGRSREARALNMFALKLRSCHLPIRDIRILRHGEASLLYLNHLSS